MLKSLQKKYQTLNRIELSRSAWQHNINYLEKLSGLQIAPVLKANAYGHGLAETTQLCDTLNLPFIVVDGYHEALTVRQHSSHHVLVLGAIDPVNFKNIATEDFAFAVGNIKTLNAICALSSPVKIHIELDTGMKRHGFAPDQMPAILKTLSKHPLVQLEGVMSHLADADNHVSNQFTDQQIETFDAAVDSIISHGFSPNFIHIAQSAGTTRKKSKYANTARPGIVAYGINPLDKADTEYESLQQTKPIMRIVSKIGAVQTVQPEQSISYSRTYTANRRQTIGVIPFGYYEGLPRATSNTAVLTDQQGKQLTVRGRICMNHTMLDISDTKLKPGDEVVVISDKREQPNSLQSLCDQFRLFNYEVLVHIASATRRVIVD